MPVPFSPLPSIRSLLRPAALTLVLLCASPAVANEPNGATIQWAQQVLDEAGFYNGRAHGRMDAATATAISNYQRSVGLRATGRLDQATIDRMLVDRQSRETPTMGNLADPGARARPSAPVLREQDVIPQAAPSAPGVQVEGAAPSAGGAQVGQPVTGPGGGPMASPAPGVSAAPGAGGDVQPQAAARAGVEVEGGAPAAPLFDISNLTAPGWVRYALLGLVGGILVLMAAIWAFSGRRTRPRVKAAKPAAPARGPARPGARTPAPPPGPSRTAPLAAGPLSAAPLSAAPLAAAPLSAGPAPAAPRAAGPAAPRPGGVRQPPTVGPAPGPAGRREPSFGVPAAPQPGTPAPGGLRGFRR